MRMAQSGPTVDPESEVRLSRSPDTPERAWPSAGLTGALCGTTPVWKTPALGSKSTKPKLADQGHVPGRGVRAPSTAIYHCMTPQQCRAARGWLDMSQSELATLSNVSLSTVGDFEKGRRVPIANTLNALKRTLETKGITFTDGGILGPTP